MYNVTNYYSVTDNNFQLIVDFWHMLLVNDDDDVGFFVRLCYVLRLKIYFFNLNFISFFVHVGVCMINQHSMHSFVTIGDQLGELCSFSGSLPHTYINKIIVAYM